MFEKVVVLGDSAQHPRRHPKKGNKLSAPDPLEFAFSDQPAYICRQITHQTVKATKNVRRNNAQTDVTALLQASGLEGNPKKQGHYVKHVITIT